MLKTSPEVDQRCGGVDVRGRIKGHYKYTGIEGNTSLGRLMGSKLGQFQDKKGF